MVYTGYEGYGYASAQAMGMLMPPSGPVYFINEEPEEEPLNPSLDEVRSLLDEDLQKHPLEHIWTVWHWENDRSKSWGDMLSEVTSFDTVEDFFSVYYFIKPPSDLRVLNDYMVFKHGVRPMWEDIANKDGGRWIIILEKSAKAMSDYLWHDLLLCCIGECFKYSDEICGVVINVRNKANKLSLWTKNSRNKRAVLSLGRQLKNMLHLNDIQIHYQLHTDAMIQHGPNVNTIYKL
ncbi:eukaryotic translation initiation factor 4E1 [Drosophila miranda]|uniref:eukaryotic translation initiation factor 4E1 n=1 Tax=Drosophila miranda TaxID=7229 RepID=UPI0007E6AB13|nr:eukaryotic translation initiation factor 4E1 [Drosophila miranda]